MGYRWTFHEHMVAFLQFAFAYCLLCISLFIFVASKFLVYLPCSCSGIFGYQNRNLCVHKLLFDWRIKTVLKIHKLVTSSFPFHSSWHHKELEKNGAKIHENSDLKICNGRDCCSDKVKLLEEALEEERAGKAALMVELEEERAAAASAVDESMAMTLRLDKACVQMEGKQYERMVEEILPYDEEERGLVAALMVELERERDAAASAAEASMALIQQVQEDRASLQMQAKNYKRRMEENHAYYEQSINVLNEKLKWNPFLEQELENKVKNYSEHDLEYYKIREEDEGTSKTGEYKDQCSKIRPRQCLNCD